MPAHASSAPDRLLDLNDLLRELVSQGYLTQATAEQCLTIRRSAVNNQQPPRGGASRPYVADEIEPHERRRAGSRIAGASAPGSTISRGGVMPTA